ncbi:MAG: glutathione S-transferase family protein [Gammaproteobacteria bacterium]|nr:glutathione S-transferase family protein [Gammaproteobacteria bacterium]
MKLFWAPQTRSSRAVWLLEEAGVNYERQLVDIRSPDRHDTDEFLAASPMGKVPALVDGDVMMSESAAIALYVADRYCSGTLAPALDDAARGKFLYWIMYTPAVVEPAMAEKFSGIEPNRVSNGWGDFDLMIATLENGLRDRIWLLGEQFTAADVMVGSSVVFMRMFDMLPGSETLNAYADRCLARPHYQTALSLEKSN